MTDRQAIKELKMLLTKHRGDFYSDTREAIEMAINALYEQEEGLAWGRVWETWKRQIKEEYDE